MFICDFVTNLHITFKDLMNNRLLVITRDGIFFDCIVNRIIFSRVNIQIRELVLIWLLLKGNIFYLISISQQSDRDWLTQSVPVIAVIPHFVNHQMRLIRSVDIFDIITYRTIRICCFCESTVVVIDPGFVNRILDLFPFSIILWQIGIFPAPLQIFIRSNRYCRDITQ